MGVQTISGWKNIVGNRYVNVGDMVYVDNGFALVGNQQFSSYVPYVPTNEINGFFELTNIIDNGNYGTCLFFHDLGTQSLKKDQKVIAMSLSITDAYMAYDVNNMFFFRETDKKISVAKVSLDDLSISYYSFDFDTSIYSLRLVGITNGQLIIECFTVDYTSSTGATYCRYRMTGDYKEKISYLDEITKREIIKNSGTYPAPENVEESLLAIETTGFDGAGPEKSISVAGQTLTASLNVGEKRITYQNENISFMSTPVFGNDFSFINTSCQYLFSRNVVCCNTIDVSGIIPPQNDDPTKQLSYLIAFGGNSSSDSDEYYKALYKYWNLNAANYININTPEKGTLKEWLDNARYMPNAIYTGFPLSISTFAQYSFQINFDMKLNASKVARTSINLPDAQNRSISSSIFALAEGSMGINGSNGVLVNTNLDGSENTNIKHNETTGPYSLSIIDIQDPHGLEVEINGLSDLPRGTDPYPESPNDQYTLNFDLGNEFNVEATGYSYRKSNQLLLKKQNEIIFDFSNDPKVGFYMTGGTVDQNPAICAPISDKKSYLIINGDGYIVDDKQVTPDGNSFNSHYTIMVSTLKLRKSKINSIKNLLPAILSGLS